MHRFRRISGLLLLTFALLTLCNCTKVMQSATSEHRPLSFVGQLSFGVPVVHAGEVRVPFSMTGGEWHQNSGLTFHHIKSRVRGGEIEIRISSAVVSGEPVPKELRLGTIKPGTYSLFYCDPDGTRHPLGPLTISPAR